MSNTSRIAAALVVTFLIFITAKGELSTYLSFFGLGTKGAKAVAAGGSASSGSGGLLGVVSGVVGDVEEVAT